MANKKGMNPVEAGIIGAAAGLAVGATAVALSSEENREKIGKEFNKVKEEVGKAVSQGQAAVEEKVGQAKEAVKSKL
jgi:KaiC/GvpD/RAD55 family RecA-like ATPase